MAPSVLELPPPTEEIVSPQRTDRDKPGDRSVGPAQPNASAAPKLATACEHRDRPVRARGRCGSCYNALTRQERRQRLAEREEKRRLLGGFWEHKVLAFREGDGELIDDVVMTGIEEQAQAGFEATAMATFKTDEILVLFRRRELPPESGRLKPLEELAPTGAKDFALSPAHA